MLSENGKHGSVKVATISITLLKNISSVGRSGVEESEVAYEPYLQNGRMV
jgi:hypothetical protein